MGSLLKYFLLTYAVTWSCFITVVKISHGPTSAAPTLALVRGFLLLLGTFAPSLVALELPAVVPNVPKMVQKSASANAA